MRGDYTLSHETRAVLQPCALMVKTTPSIHVASGFAALSTNGYLESTLYGWHKVQTHVLKLCLVRSAPREPSACFHLAVTMLI